MDCIRVSQNIHDYLDGEMGRVRRLAVARHLDGCAACSSGFTFEMRLRQTLSSACQEQAPAQLRRRVLDAIESAATHGPFDGPFDVGPGSSTT